MFIFSKFFVSQKFKIHPKNSQFSKLYFSLSLKFSFCKYSGIYDWFKNPTQNLSKTKNILTQNPGLFFAGRLYNISKIILKFSKFIS